VSFPPYRKSKSEKTLRDAAGLSSYHLSVTTEQPFQDPLRERRKYKIRVVASMRGDTEEPNFEELEFARAAVENPVAGLTTAKLEEHRSAGNSSAFFRKPEDWKSMKGGPRGPASQYHQSRRARTPRQ